MQRIEVSAKGQKREDVVSAVALLRNARSLIAEKSSWTREVFARDRHSHQVPPTSPRAQRFCAAGAILRADADLNGTVYTFVKHDVPFDVSAAVEIALDALMITATAEAGLVLVGREEFERVTEILDALGAFDPERSQKPDGYFAPPAEPALARPAIEWYELAIGINDFAEITHAKMLRALDEAADRLGADIAAAS